MTAPLNSPRAPALLTLPEQSPSPQQGNKPEDIDIFQGISNDIKVATNNDASNAQAKSLMEDPKTATDPKTYPPPVVGYGPSPNLDKAARKEAKKKEDATVLLEKYRKCEISLKKEQKKKISKVYGSQYDEVFSKATKGRIERLTEKY